MEEVDGNYESDNSSYEYSLGEDNHKKRKYGDDERLKRCRERNRIHARNTRERKRIQMEGLQQRIQDLMDEKIRLSNLVPDTSIASILMSLSSNDKDQSDMNADIIEQLIESSSDAKDAKKSASLTMDALRAQVTALLNEDGDLELDQSILSQFKDKSNCSTMELDKIRRERNRMHAKKTRLRKKKMLNEMETIISNLEEDIEKVKVDLLNQGIEIESFDKKDFASIETKAEKKSSRNGPPTGFRHSKYRIHENNISNIHSSSSSNSIVSSKTSTFSNSSSYSSTENKETETNFTSSKRVKIQEENYMNAVETSSTVSSNEGSSLNGSGTTSRDGINSSFSSNNNKINEENSTCNEVKKMNINNDSLEDNSHSLSSLEYKCDIIPLRSKLSMTTNCAENIYFY